MILVSKNRGKIATLSYMYLKKITFTNSFLMKFCDINNFPLKKLESFKIFVLGLAVTLFFDLLLPLYLHINIHRTQIKM
jgi:hypothetical protein